MQKLSVNSPDREDQEQLGRSSAFWRSFADNCILSPQDRLILENPSMGAAPIGLRARLLGSTPLVGGLEAQIFTKKAQGLTLGQFHARIRHVLHTDKPVRPSKGLKDYHLKHALLLPVYSTQVDTRALTDERFLDVNVQECEDNIIKLSPHRLLALVNDRPAGFVSLRTVFRVPLPRDPKAEETASVRMELHIDDVFVPAQFRKMGLGDFLSETAAFLFLQEIDAVSRKSLAYSPVPASVTVHSTAYSVAGMRFAERAHSHLNRHRASGAWHLTSFTTPTWEAHISETSKVF